MTDTSKLVAEAAAISKTGSPKVRVFADDAAQNLVAQAARLKSAEARLAVLEGGVQPPPPPPPGGTVRDAHTVAETLTAIAASKAGDVVYVRAGQYGKLTLQQDFLGAKILCEAGSQFAGVDTNGCSNYIFDGLRSVLPPEFQDYNVAAFYCHGASKKIVLLSTCKLAGGYLCFKQYGDADQITLSGEAWGAGGDISHWDGIRDFTIDDFHGHDPLQTGPEHPDGIQVQRCVGTGYIGPKTRLVCKVVPGRDVDGQGIFLRREPLGVGMGSITVDGTYIEWSAGRAFQAYDVDTVTLRNLQIPLSGNGTTSPKITLGPTIAGRVDLFGIPAGWVYLNGGTDPAKVVWH